MPRKGHKPGCQCAICKRMDAKLATPLVEARVEVTPESALTFKQIEIGGLFWYQSQMYRKLSQTNANNLKDGGDEVPAESFELDTIIGRRYIPGEIRQT